MRNNTVDSSGQLVKVPGSISTLTQRHVPQQLSMDGFQDQIAFSHYFHSYRWAYFWRPLMRITADGRNDVMYKASLAVALGYLAKQKDNTELLHQAHCMYSKSVDQVQLTLSRGSKVDSSRIPAIIGALGIYNVRPAY